MATSRVEVITVSSVLVPHAWEDITVVKLTKQGDAVYFDHPSIRGVLAIDIAELVEAAALASGL